MSDAASTSDTSAPSCAEASRGADAAAVCCAAWVEAAAAAASKAANVCLAATISSLVKSCLGMVGRACDHFQQLHMHQIQQHLKAADTISSAGLCRTAMAAHLTHFADSSCEATRHAADSGVFDGASASGVTVGVDAGSFRSVTPACQAACSHIKLCMSALK